jgi:hypothetical protein
MLDSPACVSIAGARGSCSRKPVSSLNESDRLIPAQKGVSHPAMSSPIEDEIFSQLAGLDPGKSVDPSQIAKALQPERWQRMLGQVRSEAVGLARQGRLVITRHGKPADPDSFKGVYRLRLPDPTAVEAQAELDS